MAPKLHLFPIYSKVFNFFLEALFCSRPLRRQAPGAVATFVKAFLKGRRPSGAQPRGTEKGKKANRRPIPQGSWAPIGKPGKPPGPIGPSCAHRDQGAGSSVSHFFTSGLSED